MSAEPASQVYFVNIYEPFNGCSGSVWPTREAADKAAGNTRLACKEIYVRPGEGIEREGKDNG